MDGKTTGIIAVAVVAVLVVAGAGIAIANNNSGSGKEKQTYEGIQTGCSLWVYGNVNGDDKLDQQDVDLLQQIVDKKASATKISVYDGYSQFGNSGYAQIDLSDVNGDNSVNKDDVDCLKKLITYQSNYSAAVKAGTLDAFAADPANKITMHYLTCDLQKASVALPVAKMGVIYWNNADVVRLLGAEGRVVLVDNTICPNHNDMLPEFSSLTVASGHNVGNTRFNLDSQTLLQANADFGMTAVFTGSSSTYSADLEKSVGIKVDVIRLPAWEDNNFMAGTLTLGYILGATEKAYEYIDWAKDIINKVSTALKDTTCVDIICAKGRVDSLTAGNGNGSGRSEITQWAGANNLVTKITPVSSEYPTIKSEWAIDANPEAIVLSGSNGFSSTTAEKVNNTTVKVYEAALETYKGTDAAKDGKIYVISDELLTGPGAIVGMVYIATLLHPDETSSLDADAIFQDYVNKFGIGSTYKVSEHKSQFIYTGPASA